MDQTAKLEPFLLLSKGARGRAAADLVYKATAEPGLYAFGELMNVPGVQELQNTDLATAYRLLELFCYGTWSDYTGDPSQFPQLNELQKGKLKQLTVVSLAGSSKRLSYGDLMAQLDVQNVRELEDLLISECFYPGLIKGKLDQRQSCLQVQEAVARDVRPQELQPIISGLANWLQASNGVLSFLEGGMVSLQEATEAAKKKQAEMEANIEAVKKTIKGNEGSSRDADFMDDSGTLEMMEMEDRSVPPPLGGRPKRRR